MRFAALLNQTQTPRVVFVVATGPSLELMDISGLRAAGETVIACNTAYKLLPGATLTHHADMSWWDQHGSDCLRDFRGQAITNAAMGVSHPRYPAEVDPVQYVFPQDVRLGSPCTTGVNAGQQGLVLAHHFRPQTIVLIGFDHQRAPDGRSHWAGAQSLGVPEQMEQQWRQAIGWYDKIEQARPRWWSAAGWSDQALPTVVNASPLTGIPHYPVAHSLTPYLGQGRRTLSD